MLHLELVYRRLLMGQEFLRKSGMRNQETQTELNETGNSNVKLKRLTTGTTRVNPTQRKMIGKTEYLQE